jgi:hypothetical protein
MPLDHNLVTPVPHGPCHGPSTDRGPVGRPGTARPMQALSGVQATCRFGGRSQRLRAALRLQMHQIPMAITLGITLDILDDETTSAYEDGHLIAQHHGANVRGLGALYLASQFECGEVVFPCLRKGWFEQVLGAWIERLDEFGGCSQCSLDEVASMPVTLGVECASCTPSLVGFVVLPAAG